MTEPYRQYVCQICGHIYDERAGDAERGLAPGTRWADVPGDWICPDCGVSKADYALLTDWTEPGAGRDA